MGEGRLTELQLRLLRLVSERGDVQTLSKETGATAAAIGMEIAKLQLGGYISEKGALTPKGSRAVQDQA
jgi:hypothetical protein